MSRKFNASTSDKITAAVTDGWSGPFTVVGWTKYLVGATHVTGIGHSNSGRLEIQVIPGGPINVVAQSAAQISSSGTTFPATGWGHWACYFQNTGAWITWIDGGQVGSGTDNLHSVNGTGTQFIGEAGNGETSDAYQADHAMWNVQLTAGEIASLANGERPCNIRPKNLRYYYPLFGLSSPEPDYSGVTRLGTVSGTTATPGIDPPLKFMTPRWPSNELPFSTAPSFIAAWAQQTNPPVLGTGIY